MLYSRPPLLCKVYDCFLQFKSLYLIGLDLLEYSYRHQNLLLLVVELESVSHLSSTNAAITLPACSPSVSAASGKIICLCFYGQ